VLLLALASGAWAGSSAEPVGLERIQADLGRLGGEVRALAGREQGILGELQRLEAELRQRTAERQRLALELDELGTAIAGHERTLARLETDQARRRNYLGFRLREHYKDGPELALRRLVTPGSDDARRAGRGYVAYLGERDGRFLAEYRREVGRLAEARAQLLGRSAERAARREEAEAAEQALEASRRARERLLGQIREDRATREAAIAELERASRELTDRLESLAPGSAGASLDVSKFRGLLDWPARGRVSAEFGELVHPRFRTTVPHPGLDIESDPEGDIRTVFDGHVVFASWMRGYGLTAIVDHGGGLLSVYAHAAVLVVGPGEPVVRGQSIGKIGDSGSLRGPYLYFELREGGRPVDPRGWLRPR